MRALRLLVIALLTVLAGPAYANVSAQRPHVTVSVGLEHAAKPGTTDWVALHFAMAPGWHNYWRNPGETGLPTRADWTLPAGVTAGPIVWPVPQRFAGDGMVDYGYTNAVTLLVPLHVAARAALKGASATARLHWLLCADMCVPQSATLTFALDEPSGDPALFAAARAAMPKPFSGVAHYAISGSQVSLLLSGGQSAGAGARFFPATARAVRDAVAPDIERTADGLRIVLQRARHPKPFSTFEGLLVLKSGRAYAVRATAAAAAPARPSAAHSAFDLLGAVLFAFVGGLILNLMPCVLPILSMKALALVRSGENSDKMRRDGLFYAAGVLVSFALVGGTLIALKSVGAAIGWGFQLQSPYLILGLWLLVSAIGLNLLGVFEVPLNLAGIGGGIVQGKSGLGAFFTGVLAVLVASPCTAPFMGAALGFALTQPPVAAFVVFLALGAGFAAPLTAFTFIPPLARLVPRPGAWMVRFKELLAFPMLATAIWLLWVLEQQTGANGLALALGVGLGITFLVWLLRHIPVAALRWVCGICGAIGLVFAVSLLQPTEGRAARSGPWRPWSVASVTAARKAGHPVFVDFSAAWCVTCLVNERVALDAPSVRRALLREHVAMFRGDWTDRNAAIADQLARYGRAGVPLYLLYPADSLASPTVLPQILTPATVTAALARLPRPPGAAIGPHGSFP